jgi:hypothetical protein
MPPEIRHATPCLGEHPEHVLCDVLGMSPHEFPALHDARILAWVVTQFAA